MMKKLIATAALLACAGGYAIAQTQVTFVLTDGQRKIGTLVPDTDKHENGIDGYTIKPRTGADQTIPDAQLAVIDFVGGQPSPAELQALPAGGTHVLVLRNGAHQQGHLVNIVSARTVIWQNQAGQQQRYALNDVGRIYLNMAAARTAYNYTGQTLGTPGVPGQAVPGTVQVMANQAWTSTGIAVKKGDRVTFTTTGQIQFGASSDMTAGPDGNGNVRSGAYPVPQMPVGGLIGKVGNSAPFSIGSNSQPIVMPASGLLLLGVNDNEANDNSGFFSVAVRKVS
ncbi:MAG: LecA/PA-IL family lectin [Betaproteobacteria bacterium]